MATSAKSHLCHLRPRASAPAAAWSAGWCSAWTTSRPSWALARELPAVPPRSSPTSRRWLRFLLGRGLALRLLLLRDPRSCTQGICSSSKWEFVRKSWEKRRNQVLQRIERVLMRRQVKVRHRARYFGLVTLAVVLQTTWLKNKGEFFPSFCLHDSALDFSKRSLLFAKSLDGVQDIYLTACSCTPCCACGQRQIFS